MEADKAQKLLYENLTNLDKLCMYRFKKDPMSGELAQSYLLEKLEENACNRIRQYKGISTFETFLTKVALRLLTQFDRKKEGYPRPPTNLPDTSCANDTFKLLKIRKWSRVEVINKLVESYELVEIEKNIQIILSQKKQLRFKDQFETVKDIDTIAISVKTSEDFIIEEEYHGFLTALKIFFSGQNQNHLPKWLEENLQQLTKRINLTDEDRLFVITWLHPDNNLSIKQIANHLELKGDAHRRFKKILNHLQEAFRETDFWEVFNAENRRSKHERKNFRQKK